MTQAGKPLKEVNNVYKRVREAVAAPERISINGHEVVTNPSNLTSILPLFGAAGVGRGVVTDGRLYVFSHQLYHAEVVKKMQFENTTYKVMFHYSRRTQVLTICPSVEEKKQVPAEFFYDYPRGTAIQDIEIMASFANFSGLQQADTAAERGWARETKESDVQKMGKRVQQLHETSGWVPLPGVTFKSSKSSANVRKAVKQLLGPFYDIKHAERIFPRITQGGYDARLNLVLVVAGQEIQFPLKFKRGQFFVKLERLFELFSMACDMADKFDKKAGLTEDKYHKPKTQFSKQLRALLATNAAYKILDSSDAEGGTWLAGGCAILARALQINFGHGELVDVGIGHIVLKAGSERNGWSYIDGYGEHQWSNMCSSMESEVGSKRSCNMKEKPYRPSDHPDIPYDESTSQKLAAFLKGKKQVAEVFERQPRGRDHVSGEHNYFYGRRGAGLVVVHAGSILLCLRSQAVNEPGTWSYPGGRLNDNEDSKRGALREFKEETGYRGKFLHLQPLTTYKEEGFEYDTFIAYVPEKFEPRLNWENAKAGWFKLDELPKRLHPGMEESLPAIKAFLGRQLSESKNMVRVPDYTNKEACLKRIYDILGPLAEIDHSNRIEVSIEKMYVAIRYWRMDNSPLLDDGKQRFAIGYIDIKKGKKGCYIDSDMLISTYHRALERVQTQRDEEKISESKSKLVKLPGLKWPDTNDPHSFEGNVRNSVKDILGPIADTKYFRYLTIMFWGNHGDTRSFPFWNEAGKVKLHIGSPDTSFGRMIDIKLKNGSMYAERDDLFAAVTAVMDRVEMALSDRARMFRLHRVGGRREVTESKRSDYIEVPAPLPFGPENDKKWFEELKSLLGPIADIDTGNGVHARVFVRTQDSLSGKAAYWITFYTHNTTIHQVMLKTKTVDGVKKYFGKQSELAAAFVKAVDYDRKWKKEKEEEEPVRIYSSQNPLGESTKYDTPIPHPFSEEFEAAINTILGPLADMEKLRITSSEDQRWVRIGYNIGASLFPLKTARIIRRGSRYFVNKEELIDAFLKAVEAVKGR